MSRRFLGALRRRDLAGIRRALFLEPLLMRNAGKPDEEENGEDPGVEEAPAPAATANPEPEDVERAENIELPPGIRAAEAEKSQSQP